MWILLTHGQVEPTLTMIPSPSSVKPLKWLDSTLNVDFEQWCNTRDQIFIIFKRRINIYGRGVLTVVYCTTQWLFFHFSHVHWLASQEGFSIKWQHDRQGNKKNKNSYFYLVAYRRRASKYDETSSKPLLVWRFFSKFQKNPWQNIPLKFIFFPFWQNFSQKKKTLVPL